MAIVIVIGFEMVDIQQQHVVAGGLIKQCFQLIL